MPALVLEPRPGGGLLFSLLFFGESASSSLVRKRNFQGRVDCRPSTVDPAAGAAGSPSVDPGFAPDQRRLFWGIWGGGGGIEQPSRPVFRSFQGLIGCLTAIGRSAREIPSSHVVGTRHQRATGAPRVAGPICGRRPPDMASGKTKRAKEKSKMKIRQRGGPLISHLRVLPPPSQVRFSSPVASRPWSLPPRVRALSGQRFCFPRLLRRLFPTSSRVQVLDDPAPRDSRMLRPVWQLTRPFMVWRLARIPRAAGVINFNEIS
ncbi:hypothetical protein LX36DRAFT_95412 [Colletotrichum falcatum]|nr:hypothetical protein LX36DRAFT_95412 [Colletotrichum falcatum]